MKKFIISFCILFLIFSFASPSYAKRPKTGDIYYVNNLSTWVTAVNSVSPGDIIEITQSFTVSNTCTGGLDYNGPGASVACNGNSPVGANGTYAILDYKPIIIRSSPGNVFTITGPGTSYDGACLDVYKADYVIVRNLKFTNCGIGIRYRQAVGLSGQTNESIHNVTVFNVGGPGIQVYENSSGVGVSYSTIYNTGLNNPSFGEGIYFGDGSQPWLDNTSGVTANNNLIYNTTSEAIDVKPGLTGFVNISANDIYNVSTQPGGSGVGIAIFVTEIPKPTSAPAPTLMSIINNDIRDVGDSDGGPFIQVNWPATLNNNRCWDPVVDALNTNQCIWVRGTIPTPSGSVVKIFDNLAWTRGGIQEDDPNNRITVWFNTYSVSPTENLGRTNSTGVIGKLPAFFPGPLTGTAGNPMGSGFDYSCPNTPSWICPKIGLTNTPG